MDRDFVLAATFAVAAHGALLFGFSKTPHPITHIQEIILGDPVPPPPPDDEPVPVEPSTTDSGPKDPPAPPVIRSAEPPMIDTPNPFIVSKPEVQPFDPTKVQSAIPANIGTAKPGFGDELSVVLSTALDKSPRTRFQPSPIYPHAAKAQGLNGEVVVEFMVDESGHVHDPRVVSASDRVFEENALHAVAKWQFEPGRRNNQVVRFRMSVPIVFKLND